MYFSYSAFWLTGQWGGAITPASPMATLLLELRHIMVNPALINALRSQKG